MSLQAGGQTDLCLCLYEDFPLDATDTAEVWMQLYVLRLCGLHGPATAIASSYGSTSGTLRVVGERASFRPSWTAILEKILEPVHIHVSNITGAML